MTGLAYISLSGTDGPDHKRNGPLGVLPPKGPEARLVRSQAMSMLPETLLPVSIPFPDSSDWDVVDWDAAWDRPYPEDEDWWASELYAREFIGMSGPLPADLEEAAR